MGERSLRVVDSNKTFFGKLSNTLSKIMIPTKIGINGLVINLKRNNLIKVYEANTNFKDNIEDDSKKQAITDKYQESYSLYLEAIDKYIMDSIYKKVKNNTASEFEKQAMGDYYKITVLKENEYIEYKYRKQKYLIELDYESLKMNSKEKTLRKYKEFYISQMDNFYNVIFKNYSFKLADTYKYSSNSKEDVYNKIFETLEEYVDKILPLKIEDDTTNILARIGRDYHRLDQFDIGKLDKKDYVEKNMLLLGISRQIFTHSLPLVATEQCYIKLLEEIREIIVKQTNEKLKMESYNLLLDLLEVYNIKLLSTKVYWERTEEREKYKKFYEKYQKAETAKEKEILFLKREIDSVKNNAEIVQFYKNRLISYGVMKRLKSHCRTSSYKFIKKK